MNNIESQTKAQKSKGNIGPALIILAACFWGSMGIFVRKLTEYGFSSVQIVSVRVTLAALVFCILLLFKDRSGFKISLRDLQLFLGLGFGSILFFTVCYFSAINIMPLSTAAILLYTSPIWIMLMSALFFREQLTGSKLLALVLAFAGCVLVSGISGEGISLIGIICSLDIIAKAVLRRIADYVVKIVQGKCNAGATATAIECRDLITVRHTESVVDKLRDEGSGIKAQTLMEHVLRHCLVIYEHPPQ